jgi:hypothetical protein
MPDMKVWFVVFDIQVSLSGPGRTPDYSTGLFTGPSSSVQKWAYHPSIVKKWQVQMVIIGVALGPA